MTGITVLTLVLSSTTLLSQNLLFENVLNY